VAAVWPAQYRGAAMAAALAAAAEAAIAARP